MKTLDLDPRECADDMVDDDGAPVAAQTPIVHPRQRPDPPPAGGAPPLPISTGTASPPTPLRFGSRLDVSPAKSEPTPAPKRRTIMAKLKEDAVSAARAVASLVTPTPPTPREMSSDFRNQITALGGLDVQTILAVCQSVDAEALLTTEERAQLREFQKRVVAIDEELARLDPRSLGRAFRAQLDDLRQRAAAGQEVSDEAVAPNRHVFAQTAKRKRSTLKSARRDVLMESAALAGSIRLRVASAVESKADEISKQGAGLFSLFRLKSEATKPERICRATALWLRLPACGKPANDLPWLTKL